MNKDTSKPIYSIADICDKCLISKSFLYKLIKQGKGPRIIKLGRRTMISAAALNDWMESLEKETQNDLQVIDM